MVEFKNNRYINNAVVAAKYQIFGDDASAEVRLEAVRCLEFFQTAMNQGNEPEDAAEWFAKSKEAAKKLGSRKQQVLDNIEYAEQYI